MKLIKKLTSLVCAAAMLSAAQPAMPAIQTQAAATTPQQILDRMGIGWNLGNSLDVPASGSSSETLWGNPKTTRELIEFVHDQGFSSIRIPVSWGHHMNNTTHKIDASYMARVKEVVDYAYDDGMYVIINIHHDNDIRSGSSNFFYPSSTYKSQSETFVKAVWSQVSETFKDYDQHLIFETLNEPRLTGTSDEWWFPVNNPNSNVKSAVSIINTLNQDAVDVIRASGGNNKTRLIMCPGYDASLDGAIVSGFKLPTDASGMVGVSIHAYVPYNYAMNTGGGAVSSYNDDMKKELASIFSTIKSKVKDKGMACYIGEFGATNKGNDTERCKWAEDYTAQAKALGIPVLLWDNNAYNVGAENFGLIDRTNLVVKYKSYLASLMKAYPKAAHTPGDADESGEIDVSDVLMIQQYTAGWNVAINLENADVDGDGSADISDALLIQQKIAGWDIELK